MAAVTVTVITLNEIANIDACLASVRWADELLVIDSGSTDGTPDRARALGARVIEHEWLGYAAQKNLAAEAAGHDWIFSLDADERVTPELAADIRRALDAKDDVAGYRVPRVTRYLGRWIRTTDWYPDYQLRLYDRRRAHWPPRLVHESVRADGPVRYLRHDLQHHAYRDISHHHEVMDRYTTLAARQMHDAGRRASLVELIFHPPAAFARNYLLRRGFQDGAPGLIISAMNAHYVLLKFAKLWSLAQARDGDAAGPKP